MRSRSIRLFTAVLLSFALTASTFALPPRASDGGERFSLPAKILQRVQNLIKKLPSISTQENLPTPPRP